MVSKYIGETGKNNAGLHDQACSRDGILFSEEVDALVGKRANVKHAHDCCANQEVGYLLQRVEDFDGVVILTTNLCASMDEAFTRRFDDVIRFPMPTEGERRTMWGRTLPNRVGRGTIRDRPRFLNKGGQTH